MGIKPVVVRVFDPGVTILRRQPGNDGVLGASNLDDDVLGASDLGDDGVLGASDLEDDDVLGASDLEDDGVLGASDLEDDGILGASDLGDDGVLGASDLDLKCFPYGGLCSSAAEGKDDRAGRVAGPMVGYLRIPIGESSPYIVRKAAGDGIEGFLWPLMIMRKETGFR